MSIEWPLVFYTLLGGLALGLFGAVAIAEWTGTCRRICLRGAITSLVILALSGIVSVFHLGHPERIFNALVANIQSSIAQEMLLMGLTGLALLVYIYLAWKKYAAKTRRITAIVGLALAVLLLFVLANSYVLPSRPAWNTWLLAALFFASAAVLGLLSMWVWAIVGKEDADIQARLNLATLVALVVQAGVVAAYVLYLWWQVEASPARLLTGDLAVVFWLGMVVIGLAVPIAVTAWLRSAGKKAGPVLPLVAISLVGALAGGVVTRAVLFLIGSRVALF